MTRRTTSRLVGSAAAGCLVVGALVSGVAPGQAAVTRSSAAVTRIPAAAPAATPMAVPAGTNLLSNPGAEAGARSARGWDAVTIPGWRVARGLPTVVRYGTRGFPARAGHHGRALFAGGAGGTARLVKRVPLRAPGGGSLRHGTRYDLSGWLGGSASSHSSVSVRFISAAGHVVRRRALAPARGTATHRAGPLVHRALAGHVPAHAVAADVTIRLTTRLRTYNGFYSAIGYNRAVADNVRFSLSSSARRPRGLVPPAAHVPHFDHVFVFYFENQDYKKVIGNRKQAPFFNSLRAKGSLLTQLYAEEHPSDGNYLALAGGSTFGIPLTDPLEENPQYTIRATNIGDLLTDAHETWKGYLQSANGPCDDTVHDAYWDDDLPFLYFKDVRDRPKYCAAHMVPLHELQPDLNSGATPSFSWVSPDDCYDMEGCGIKAGDRFLAAQLGRIMASPAWTTQRSLAIITFDEDQSDHQHPAERVPTLMLGSAGSVKAGYTSPVRYTHYSLLRTIEAALGIGTMTKNDRYARATNDVFR
jgi:hypothetical protein